MPTVKFPVFLAPSTTIAGAAATPEAALLGDLFLALQANRQWITDSTLKSQDLDDVKESKDETLALVSDLNVKPQADRQCSRKKRKRSPISEKKLRSLVTRRSLILGLSDLVGDAARLLSCACANNIIAPGNATSKRMRRDQLHILNERTLVDPSDSKIFTPSEYNET